MVTKGQYFFKNQQEKKIFSHFEVKNLSFYTQKDYIFIITSRKKV